MTPVCGRLDDALEAHLRARVVTEALTWQGTPYVGQGDRKGQCVDCCMLLVRVWVDTGIAAPFDPRPYQPQGGTHRPNSSYLDALIGTAIEVPSGQAGDLVLWQFGRSFWHGGIMVSRTACVQASAAHGRVDKIDLAAPWLAFIGRTREPRPKKFFDVFAGIRRLEAAREAA